MNQNTLTILVALNIAATAGLGGWMLSTKDAQPAQPAAPTGPESSAELTESIDDLKKGFGTLSTTLQRFNTSMIQYDFLKEEMEDLATIERAVAMRQQALNSRKTEDNAEDVDKAVQQLTTLNNQLAKQRQARRQVMLALISGLEKQLAGLAGATTVADKVPAVPPEAPKDSMELGDKPTLASPPTPQPSSSQPNTESP